MRPPRGAQVSRPYDRDLRQGFRLHCGQHSSAPVNQKAEPVFHATVAHPNFRSKSVPPSLILLHAKICRSQKSPPASSPLAWSTAVGFWVTSERVLEPSGMRVLREVVRHTGSVVVLATEQGSVNLCCCSNASTHAAKVTSECLQAVSTRGKGARPRPSGSAGGNRLHRKTLEANPQVLREPGFVAEQMTVFWGAASRRAPAQPEADEVIEHALSPCESHANGPARHHPGRQNHLLSPLACPPAKRQTTEKQGVL